MSLSLFSSRNRIANIVINDHSIRCVEIRSTNNPIPYRWGERYLPQGIITNGNIQDMESLSNILEECIGDWKIARRQIRFIVPDPFVIIRKVPIPIDILDDEIEGYIFSELGISIHLPFDEPVFQAIVLEEKTELKEVLIFAAQEEKVRMYANLFSSLKLKPVAADISSLCFYRLYEKLGLAEKDEQLLIAQFDVHMVNITIFENHIPLLTHHIQNEIRENQWEQRLNEKGQYELNFIGEKRDLDFQFADTYKEIGRLMDFYRYSLNQGNKKVSKILVIGDHPFLNLIKEEMKNRFNMPIIMFNHEHFRYDQDHLLPPSHYLAYGLALKGV